jgi:hypothetical protein
MSDQTSNLRVGDQARGGGGLLLPQQNAYPSFSEWLGQQGDRDDPVGDVARDELWARENMPDCAIPTGRIRLRELFEFLEGIDACEGALEAFLRAWKEWRAARPA